MGQIILSVDTGSSRLTYEIGHHPDSGIHLRISKNSGGGFFSDEWVSFEDILQALKKRSEGKPITSILLHPLFKGKSVNTPAFLLSVLLHEKLVRSPQGKLRRHELEDPSVFTAKVEKLMSSGTEAKSKPARKLTGNAPRKKAATRKKAKTV